MGRGSSGRPRRWQGAGGAGKAHLLLPGSRPGHLVPLPRFPVRKMQQGSHCLWGCRRVMRRWLGPSPPSCPPLNRTMGKGPRSPEMSLACHRDEGCCSGRGTARGSGRAGGTPAGRRPQVCLFRLPLVPLMQVLHFAFGERYLWCLWSWGCHGCRVCHCWRHRGAVARPHFLLLELRVQEPMELGRWASRSPAQVGACRASPLTQVNEPPRAQTLGTRLPRPVSPCGLPGQCWIGFRIF